MTRKPEMNTAAAEPAIVSIKGFNLDWTCRNFQYAIGASYEHAGEVRVCDAGFHAIGPEGHPLEVFSHYSPGTSRYAEVRQSGALSRHGMDGKVASARIAVVAEITMPDLIGRAIKWVMDRAKPEGGSSATGYQGAASATGEQGAASATGEQGAASATGSRGAASATGEQGIALAGGYEGKAMAAEGCALFLVSRDYDTGKIIHAWAGIAGRDGIKPMTWYRLGGDGQPVEVA